MKKPKLYVIAGPNGAGKTTFAEQFLPHYADCFEFINADMIAKGLSPFMPSKVAIKAGKILLDQIGDCLRRKVDFAFETTLAGKSYNELFKKAKQEGYELHLFFLWLPDVSISLARIADRVQKGGHDIPKTDVKRRFIRGIRNLFHLYQSLFDTWTVFDNSAVGSEIIMISEKNKLSVLNRTTYQKLLKQAGT